jgi:hypothetical protein
MDIVHFIHLNNFLSKDLFLCHHCILRQPEKKEDPTLSNPQYDNEMSTEPSETNCK